MTTSEKAYALRRAVQELETWIINAENLKHAEPMSAIWTRLRMKVGEVDLAMRAVRSAVQSRKRASAKTCPHEGEGAEKSKTTYDGVKLETRGLGFWRCRFCRAWTTVPPKAAAPQAVKA